jgi:hypothetical protein
MGTWKKAVVAGVVGAATTVMISASAATADVPDSPDDVVSGAKDLGGGAQFNLRRGVFVAKDLGGGAYWLATTTAIATTVEGAETGRETILTVNEGVIRPAQDATGL